MASHNPTLESLKSVLASQNSILRGSRRTGVSEFNLERVKRALGRAFGVPKFDLERRKRALGVLEFYLGGLKGALGVPIFELEKL